jgi:ATP-dependent Clp protease ATP-binding subunit ClpC
VAEHTIDLVVHEDAITLISKRGYDPTFGARPLRRIITNLIEDPLAEGLLEGRFKDGDTIVIDTADNLLRLRSQREIEQTEPAEEPAMA